MGKSVNIQQTVEKIMGDKKLMELFKKDPEKAIESVIGIDLPDGIVDKVSGLIKANITADKLGDAADLLKKLF